ncbi:MAG TPA: SufD family Fe-S cluster assembly protein, partial [Pirellulales bacterium]
MPDAATAHGFNQDTFDAFLAGRHEPDWATDLRRQGWDAFRSLNLPDRSHEEWRRTDVRALKLDKFGFALQPTANELPPALLNENVELGGRLACLDGFPQFEELNDEYAAKGVLFGSLERLICDHEDRLKPLLTSPKLNLQADKFSALHSAAWTGGAALIVPQGLKLELPLHILSAMSPDGVDFSRLLVVLEDGAEATLLHETASPHESAGLHCGSTEIVVGVGAKLRFVSLQNWGFGAWHFAHQKAFVESKGELQWTVGALGARLAKVNQHVALTGEEAKAQVNGVMFTEGKQHLAYHTLQAHEAYNCESDLLYKGALQDESRLVWRGMIRVEPGADKTNGYQRNDNLMLSSA